MIDNNDSFQPLPLLKNDDPMYRFLREGDIKSFNQQKANGIKLDLANCDFCNVDLRGLDASGIDFSGCYFRQADLRGVDFSETNLESASINGAMISGVYFPKRLSADEIELSIIRGTRMRYDK